MTDSVENNNSNNNNYNNNTNKRFKITSIYVFYIIH